jgi:hypothetical protein
MRRDAAALRRSGVRFYAAAGGNHGAVLAKWTVEFADELRTLELPHELWRLPKRDTRHFWKATFPSALRYATARSRDRGFVASSTGN